MSSPGVEPTLPPPQSHASYVRIWKTIDELKREGFASKSTGAKERYAEITTQVVSILETLGHTHAECKDWNGIFCKGSLRHEVEESIVALHHLHEWMSKRGDDGSNTKKLTIVDICCGKGFFSMLLSYMVGTFWQDCGIDNIVLLDKRTDINWRYINVANETATAENRPHLTIWKGVNLHEYDIVLDRLLGLQTQLGLVGIHLCKNLSPAAVSLVHGLGREKCPYLLLAPCCMPRSITSKYIRSSAQNIRVYQYESPCDRSRRLAEGEQRNRAMGKGKKMFCYLCNNSSAIEHRVRDCHIIKGVTPQERTEILQAASVLLPCWKCGGVGHKKANCLLPQMPTKDEPPSRYYDVGSVSKAPQPFAQYCQVLGAALRQQDEQGAEGASATAAFSSVVIHETGLTNTDSAHEQDPSQQADWTKGRKSIYIVATSSN